MFKFILNTLLLYLFITTYSLANKDFDNWLINFQIKAVEYGISDQVVKSVMSDAKFLPKVIEYDRYQPDFYEDTFTYIKKRSSNRKI